MSQGVALPLWQIVCLDVFAPPIGTALWWLMSRGFASAVQGGQVKDNVKRRQRVEFFVLLIAAYVVAIGMTIWGLSGH